ncbi:hypothetical protein PJE062_535 [Pseudovibrio sp. JE062]|nr:hypothetical protein PJE062_535 [Pseudovibrio sp. JE062]
MRGATACGNGAILVDRHGSNTASTRKNTTRVIASGGQRSNMRDLDIARPIRPCKQSCTSSVCCIDITGLRNSYGTCTATLRGGVNPLSIIIASGGDITSMGDRNLLRQNNFNAPAVITIRCNIAALCNRHCISVSHLNTRGVLAYCLNIASVRERDVPAVWVHLNCVSAVCRDEKITGITVDRDVAIGIKLNARQKEGRRDVASHIFNNQIGIGSTRAALNIHPNGQIARTRHRCPTDLTLRLRGNRLRSCRSDCCNWQRNESCGEEEGLV